MRAPGEILLISCYELGHQPLSLASAAGFLSAAGHAPACLDLSRDTLTDSAVVGARLVAIAVPMHTALRLGVAAAERVRSINPSAHIVMFGLYASLNAARLFERGLIDSAIGGECEEPLVALAEALATGQAPEVPGVSTARMAAGPWLRRLSFALPDRTQLPPLTRYAGLIDGTGGERAAGYVEASRGCLHMCGHCPIVPIYDGRFFTVPADVVLADARAQIAAGATHLTFGDPDFLNGPGHSLRIARALHAEHPSLTFDLTTKVEHILRHHEVFAELRTLGCAFVVSAVESLSDAVLLQLEKGHTRQDVDRALAILDGAGIALRPTLVPFTPWATLDDLLELFDWVLEHGLVESIDPIQYSIRLLVPPGSRLLATGSAPAGGDWPGPLDPDNFSHRWRHRDPRMDELADAFAQQVGQAAARGESADQTFAGLRALARGAAGLPERPQAPMTGPRRDHPPRLAEAWFC